MLILTRKLGESIIIGDKVKVTVVGVEGRQVRLGIDAPGEVGVYREELYTRIEEENRRAAGTGTKELRKVVEVLKRNVKGR